VVQFPIGETIVGKRAHRINDATVQELAESIEAVGLLHPTSLSALGLSAHR